MKRFGSQFNKKAQSIRLSAAERADLRDRLVSYMEYHPLPKSESVTKHATSKALAAEPYRVIKVNYAYISSIMGAFAMIILVIVPVVAEKAVPGDVLYPVKVQFNEELRSTLTFSSYDKIEWETKRLERRLAEARLLADEGKLTEEIEAEVAEAVQAHSEAAKQEIATIRESDSDEAALAEITLASALDVQSEVLASRESQAGEAGRSVAILASTVAEARDGVEASHKTTNLSYEKLFARVETQTTYAGELFESIKTSASADEVKDIERRFVDIKRKVDEANMLHLASSSVEVGEIKADSEEAVDTEPTLSATDLLKVALTDTRKLISFMTDIDVRNSVTIDELVPVTLTPEEKGLMAAEAVQKLQEQVAIMELAVAPEGNAEKFEYGQAELLKTLNKALVAYAANDYDQVMKIVAEADQMVKDLQAMALSADLPTDKSTSTETNDLDAEIATSTVSVGEVAGTSTEAEV